jgi:hypothetical protein
MKAKTRPMDSGIGRRRSNIDISWQFQHAGLAHRGGAQLLRPGVSQLDSHS